MRREFVKCLMPFLVLFVFFVLVSDCTKKKDQGIEWMTDLQKALTIAEKQDKPLMIDFMATWCPPCKKMEDSTFSDPRVIEKAGSFVTLRIDVDKQGEIADKYNCNASKYGGIGIPNILFMTHEEKRLRHIIGYRKPDVLLSEMDSVLSVYYK